jgi:diguanylate cyclase (GGDEF)-like protein/PAS domain S-box-containing protein
MSQLEVIRLADICAPDPICVEGAEPLSNVLHIMETHHISCVVITRDRRPLGIFTERDALQAVAEGMGTASVPIRTRMTPEPLTCGADESFIAGYARMAKHGIRHLVLTDAAGDITGVVTETDFAAALDEGDYLRPKTVAELMVRTPATVPPEASVAKALAMMLERRISSVVVVRDERPIGVLTERDCYRLNRADQDLTSLTLADIMTHPVTSIGPDMLVHEAGSKMRVAGVRRFTVVDDAGRLIGIVSRHDLVKDLRGRYEDLLRELVHHQSREISKLRAQLGSDFALDALLEQERVLGIVAADAGGIVRYVNAAVHRFLALAASSGSRSDDAATPAQTPPADGWPDLAAGACPLRAFVQRLGGDPDLFGKRLASIDPGQHADCDTLSIGERGQLAIRCELAALGKADGSIGGYLLLLHDETERLATEERFAKIFDGTPSAVVITRLSDGVIVDANRSFFELSGFAKDEIIGHSSADVAGWVDPKQRQHYLTEISAGRQVRGLRVLFRRRGGEILHGRVNGERIQLQGEPCALSAMSDITAEHRYLEQIEHQHELFDAVFHAISDAFLITDTERRIILANRAVEVIFGHPPSALVGQRAVLLYASERDYERTGRERFHPEAEEQRHPYTIDYRRASGEVFPGETVGTVIRGRDGRFLGYVSVIRDVSEREQARRLLETNERRLQDLIDTLSDWVWEIDVDGRFTFVSDRILQMLGYDPNWMLGKRYTEIMPKAEVASANALFDSLSMRVQPFSDLEFTHLHKDGQARILRVAGVPIFSADGTVQGYRGTSRDVTDAHHAAERLRTSEAQLQAIFDNANVGIMLLTGYRVLARCNRRLAEILGYPDADAMVGISMRALHIDDACFADFGLSYYEQLREREQLHIEYQLRRKDGSAVWCLLSGTALDSAQPADLNQGVIWTVDDISRIKRKERQLERLNAELSEDHDLFTSGPTMVFRWLPQPGWLVSYCSPNVETLLGIQADELLSGKRGYAELIHPDDLTRVHRQVDDSVHAGAQGFEREYRLRTASGQWGHFYDYTRVLYDADGQVCGYHGYLVDITEQRRRETTLSALMQAIPDLIFVKDRDGRYVECNVAFSDFIGRAREDILGATDYDLFEPREAEFFRAKDRAAIASGQPQRNDEWLTYPDGSRRLCDMLKSPFASEDETRPGVLGIGRDMTQQHWQAHELERAQIIADLGSGHEDLHSGEVYWSPNLYRILGLDPDRVQPGSEALLDCVHEADRPDVRRLLLELRDGERVHAELEYRIRRPDGEIRWLYSRRELLHDATGESVRIEGIVQDITNRRQALEALQQSQDRLQEAQRVARLGSWSLEIDSGALLWSPEVFRIFALDPTTFVPSFAAFLTRVHPDDREAVRQAYQQSIEQHSDYSIIHRILLPNGDIKYVEERARIDYDPDAKPTRAIGTVLDVTERRLDKLALSESEERYRSMFDAAGQAMQMIEADGTIITANQSACDLLGYPNPAALIGAPIQDLSPRLQPDGEVSKRKGERLIALALETGAQRFEWEHLRLDGQAIPVEVTLSRLQLKGRTTLLSTWQDLRDRRRADELEVRATAVFSNTAEGIMITDADNRIIAVNPAFSTITGYREDEVRGRGPSFLQSGRQDRAFYRAMWQQLHETGSWSGEIWNRRKDGDIYAEWLSISLIRETDGSIRNHIAVFSDMTQARRSAAEIAHLTHYDLLTGLPNPILLRARLDQALESAKAAGHPLAVLMLNLDGFKRVVSSYGHESADAVLVEVTRRLKGLIPSDATLARPGGDTFTVLLELDPRQAMLGNQVQALQRALREKILVSGIDALGISCCIGIALSPTDAETSSELLRDAESALHTAKAAGPGSIAYYRPEMTEAATRRLALEQALHGALAENQFELFYQPKLDLDRTAICGAEALIRWRKPDGELLLPGAFMSIVETSDLVNDVGRWVLQEAATTARQWQRQGRPDVPISVNISSAMVASGTLATDVAAVIEQTGIDPTLLEIEVLENVLIDDPVQAQEELVKVRRLGVRIALDDFGTGYSSLGYLKRFPFDYLKIDRRFIGELQPGSDDMAIVRSTISMAHHLGLRVVAEGVESDAHINYLVGLGCDMVQGYRIGKPMSKSTFAALLQTAGDGDVLSADLRRLISHHILLVTQDAEQCALLQTELNALGWDMLHSEQPAAALDLLANEQVWLLIADLGPLAADTIGLLEQVRQQHPELVRVLTSDTPDAALLVDAINRGSVFRYLQKPYNRAQLADLLDTAYQLSKTLKQTGALDTSLVAP